MVPEDVFASHDLVLKLWLRETVTVPRASTLSTYYDVFRRVLRAVSRPRGRRGRASQAIEDAIDFTMPEVSVFPANGLPAHIVLPLDQLASEGAADVEEGVQRLVAVNEWAAERQTPVRALEERLKGQEMAQHVAAQTLRLMPSSEEDMQVVELGGRLIGREHPIRIEPMHADRMVDVVKQSPKLVEFDEMGSVRAVDKDQRSMRLRVSRTRSGVVSIQCWMADERLFERASQAFIDGERIRVMGKFYKEQGSPMVIVHNIKE